MKLNRNKNKGQMLIEIVVALGIIGLVLVGVSDLMTRSIRVASFQQQREDALTIIKKMLIDYKTERDTDPSGFYDSVANELIDPCVVDLPYRCEVVVNKSADSVLITVTAEWEDGGDNYSVTLSETLARQVK